MQALLVEWTEKSMLHGLCVVTAFNTGFKDFVQHCSLVLVGMKAIKKLK